MLTDAVTPTIGRYVSTQILGTGFAVAKGKEQRTMLIGESVTTCANKSKGQHDFSHGLNRGVVSHSVAQADALSEFVSDPAVAHTWSVNIFDDASMWVAKSEIQQHITDIERVDPAS